MVDIEGPSNGFSPQFQLLASWNFLPTHHLLAGVVVGGAVTDVGYLAGHRGLAQTI